MDYLLIHGYGVGAQYASIHQPEGLNGGFGAFDNLISRGKAKVFRWDIARSFKFWEFMNPANDLKLYYEEMAKAKSQTIHQSLEKELFELQPKTIVCHSMGSLLLISYLKNHTLPNSVVNIVFVQGSILNDTQIPTNLLTKMENNQIKLINLYCPWDQALLTVLLLTKTVTAGLTGYKHPKIKNIFFPLYKRLNLHTSSINDANLIKLLEKL